MPKPEIYGNQVVEAAKALYEQLSHWAGVSLNYSILLHAVHTVTGANDLSDRIKSIIHQNGSIALESFAQFAEVSLFQVLTPGTGGTMSVYTQRYIWAKILWACAAGSGQIPQREQIQTWTRSWQFTNVHTPAIAMTQATCEQVLRQAVAQALQVPAACSMLASAGTHSVLQATAPVAERIDTLLRDSRDAYNAWSPEHAQTKPDAHATAIAVYNALLQSSWVADSAKLLRPGLAGALRSEGVALDLLPTVQCHVLQAFTHLVLGPQLEDEPENGAWHASNCVAVKQHLATVPQLDTGEGQQYIIQWVLGLLVTSPSLRVQAAAADLLAAFGAHHAAFQRALLAPGMSWHGTSVVQAALAALDVRGADAAECGGLRYAAARLLAVLAGHTIATDESGPAAAVLSDQVVDCLEAALLLLVQALGELSLADCCALLSLLASAKLLSCTRHTAPKLVPVVYAVLNHMPFWVAAATGNQGKSSSLESIVSQRVLLAACQLLDALAKHADDSPPLLAALRSTTGVPDLAERVQAAGVSTSLRIAALQSLALLAKPVPSIVTRAPSHLIQAMTIDISCVPDAVAVFQAVLGTAGGVAAVCAAAKSGVWCTLIRAACAAGTPAVMMPVLHDVASLLRAALEATNGEVEALQLVREDLVKELGAALGVLLQLRLNVLTRVQRASDLWTARLIVMERAAWPRQTEAELAIAKLLYELQSSLEVLQESHDHLEPIVDKLSSTERRVVNYLTQLLSVVVRVHASLTVQFSDFRDTLAWWGSLQTKALHALQGGSFDATDSMTGEADIVQLVIACSKLPGQLFTTTEPTDVPLADMVHKAALHFGCPLQLAPEHPEAEPITNNAEWTELLRDSSATLNLRAEPLATVQPASWLTSPAGSKSVRRAVGSPGSSSSAPADNEPPILQLPDAALSQIPEESSVAAANIEASALQPVLQAMRASGQDLSPDEFATLLGRLCPGLPGMSGALLFSALDSNKDGKLSVRELSVGLAQLATGSIASRAALAFSAFDLDSNGVIDDVELAQVIGHMLQLPPSDPRVVQRVAAVMAGDTDGDGVLSRAEFCAIVQDDPVVASTFAAGGPVAASLFPNLATPPNAPLPHPGKRTRADS